MISRTSKAHLMALCPGHDTQDGALSEALEALWAVRVLDALHARLRKERGQYTDPPHVVSLSGSRFTMVWWGSGEFKLGEHNSEDAARVAAAKALVVDDWTLSPKGWP